MKIGMEKLWGLRYKLRIMDIPLSGQSLIYIYNMSVIKIHKELSLHCIRKEIQYVKMQSKGHLKWENHWQHGCLQVQILLICWLKFYMGQSGDILWGMYCMIATMNISNWVQDLGDIVVLCIVINIFSSATLSLCDSQVRANISEIGYESTPEGYAITTFLQMGLIPKNGNKETCLNFNHTKMLLTSSLDHGINIF